MVHMSTDNYKKKYKYIMSHPDLSLEEKLANGFYVVAQEIGWDKFEMIECIVENKDIKSVTILVLGALSAIEEQIEDIPDNYTEVIDFLESQV